ncbi:hypothetical protein BZG36_05678, partial [Bifiguratus adelaidae]
YTLDAVTGKILVSKNLGLPYNTADIEPTPDNPGVNTCGDINPYVGVTSTPVIDPSSSTVYMWSKTYLDGTTSGYHNARYKLHALDVMTLNEQPNFPYNPEGIIADNDPAVYFIGGIVLQRPALSLDNGVIYSAWGAHCDNYNYTGMVIGVNTSGVKTSFWLAESGPKRKQGSGIWMGGCGLSSDGTGRFYAVTGNGDTGVTTPTLGKNPGPILSQAVVALGKNSNGTLSAIDFFEPYNYMGLGDSDFGSG